MKKIAMLCALAALAACSEAEAPTEADTAEAAVAEAEAEAWPIEAGTYEYTRSDGVGGINTVAADGTFSNAVSGGEIETGTWAQEGGLSCLSPKGGQKRCYTFTVPDGEGNLTGTTTDGVTATIRKVG